MNRLINDKVDQIEVRTQYRAFCMREPGFHPETPFYELMEWMTLPELQIYQLVWDMYDDHLMTDGQLFFTRTRLWGFKHLDAESVATLFGWRQGNGSATLWGDSLPDVDKLLSPQGKSTSMELEKLVGEEDEPWLAFSDEVMHAYAMVVAMFVAGANAATFCWEHHRLEVVRDLDVEVCDCCSKMLSIQMASDF